MKRIYISNITKIIKIDKELENYLKKTLRFKGKEKLLIFDGKEEFSGIFEKNNTIVINEKVRVKENLFLKLAIADLKKERIEWIVEKATEIGVKDIYILKTERSQNFINKKRINKILIESCRQCNRISIPNINYENLIDFISKINKNEWFYCSLKTKNKNIDKNFKAAIIGPEGGWSDCEENLLKENFTPIYLNNLTLRSETAAISALSLINYNNFS